MTCHPTYLCWDLKCKRQTDLIRARGETFSHLPLPPTANEENIVLLFVHAFLHFTAGKKKLHFPVHLQSAVLQYSATQKTQADSQTLFLCLYFVCGLLRRKAKQRTHIPLPAVTRRREYPKEWSTATVKQPFRICKEKWFSFWRDWPCSRDPGTLSKEHIVSNDTFRALPSLCKVSW